MIPDFSPAMLKLFLRARAEFAVADSGEPWRRTERVRAFKAQLRKAAGVTNFEFEFAWMGRLCAPETRARLWAVLGHFPADHGVTLTDDGGQSLVLTASGAAPLPPDGARDDARRPVGRSPRGGEDG